MQADDHGSLVTLFETWTGEIESGLAQRYQRLAALAAADPSTLNNDDADFVRRSLSHEDTARRFLQSNREAAWVVWLEEKGLLSELLRAEGPVDKAQEEIARWLGVNYLDDERGTLLGLVERHLPDIHPCLWSHIHHKIRFDDGKIPESSFRTWIGILLSNSPAGSKDWASDLVFSAAKRRDIQSLLLLIDRLITPKIRLEHSVRLSEEQLEPTTAVTLNLLADHEDYWLRQAWEKALRPTVATLAPKLDLIIRRALALADQLLRSPGMPAAYDPLWYARRDIETSNSQYPDAFDFVIEISIEVIRLRLASADSDAIAYLDDLFGSGIPVLQRLAVAGTGIASALSADEKLRWLISKRVLHSFWFRTEAFRLLKTEIASCSEAVKRETLEAIERGPELDQREGMPPEQVDRDIFNLLHWLKEADETWDELKASLKKLQERYPDFQTPPSYDELVTVPVAQWVDPAECFDLNAVVSRPAITFLEGWLSAREHDLPGKPSQWDYGAVLPALAKRSFRWILDLAKAALSREIFLPHVWSSLAFAIREAPRTVDDWREILSVLRSATGFDAGLQFVIATLEHGVHADRDPLSEILFAEADDLAALLAQPLMQSTEQLELGDDWLEAAFNQPAGRLCRYWFKRGLMQRSSSKEKSGLPAIVTRNLSLLLKGNSPGSIAARILCGCEVQLLDYLDSGFAREVILPFFSWERNDAAALQAWERFLAGRALVSRPERPHFRGFRIDHEAMPGLAESKPPRDRPAFGRCCRSCAAKPTAQHSAPALYLSIA